MIKTTQMLINELSNYSSPKNKIQRMVENNELFPVTRGLYSTNKNIDSCYLASYIYGPSYLSFEFALSYYGLIPEGVKSYSSATYKKNRSKRYITPFGNFFYWDVPSEAFPYGIKYIKNENHSFCIASVEKALCDKLYTLPPLKNIDEIEELLFNDLRIDEEEFNKLNNKDITFLSTKYHCRNIYLLDEYLKRSSHG